MEIQKEIVKDVDDFRFEERCASRVETVEKLVVEGLRSLRAKRKKKQKTSE